AVGDLALLAGQRLPRPAAALRAPLLAGERLLGGHQCCLPPRQVPGVVEDLPLGAGRQVDDPEVEARLPARGRQGTGRDVGALDCGGPPASLAPDVEGLRDATQGPVQLELHMADALQVQTAVPLLQLPAGSVLVGGAVEPPPGLEAGEAGLVARCQPAV